MENFDSDIVLHRGASENRYLAVSRDAQKVFTTLSSDYRRPVPCRRGRWVDGVLHTPPGAEVEERVKATLLKDFGLTVGEAPPEGGLRC